MEGNVVSPKLRRHNGRCYRIEGYRVFLVPPSGRKPGWSLEGFGGCWAVRAWLSENGLREASFSTRARALDAFLLSAHLSPLPAAALEKKVPALLRNPDGSYRSRCGSWQVTRTGWGSWRAQQEASEPGQPAMGLTGATLSTLALQIHSLENSTRPSRPSAGR